MPPTKRGRACWPSGAAPGLRAPTAPARCCAPLRGGVPGRFPAWHLARTPQSVRHVLQRAAGVSGGQAARVPLPGAHRAGKQGGCCRHDWVSQFGRLASPAAFFFGGYQGRSVSPAMACQPGAAAVDRTAFLLPCTAQPECLTVDQPARCISAGGFCACAVPDGLPPGSAPAMPQAVLLSQLDAVRRELVDVVDRFMPDITFGKDVMREVLAFAQVGAGTKAGRGRAAARGARGLARAPRDGCTKLLGLARGQLAGRCRGAAVQHESQTPSLAASTVWNGPHNARPSADAGV